MSHGACPDLGERVGRNESVWAKRGQGDGVATVLVAGVT